MNLVCCINNSILGIQASCINDSVGSLLSVLFIDNRSLASSFDVLSYIFVVIYLMYECILYISDSLNQTLSIVRRCSKSDSQQ